ncbi:SDR family oxidoreductase [Xenorhabdus nematophila]|uniref:SDR family oxidoreductase n=1 Tax=Xenorhabdus nematophila TaxID=628 RepID=UPI0003275452|nr:SDR family oxidoreductase [Xenorhabdus nematophila]CEE94528.1 3-oxoacyl-(acyl-carrier-protein) reductase [Xenorhabdus nematophila str. Anatoliense]CEF30744.1 3-oxoacyl-(acyl-carrier-protein) reductase [Xenorhabdus nematophila str. Websteri]AYA40802.1 3-oxoacyl-(ACP) reductase [Xenorhabdus nematophila]KHD28639.1 3-ketoacyl-ACP reductase [Xenorhabdus nematophila]MBA0019551.1 SDR family oxidoreductase [Xenorhabdus nematophila]
MFNLTGKIAFVSGGTKGIGKGIVQVLKQAGAITIMAGTDQVKGELVAKELGVDFIALDVTDQAACKSAIDRIVEKYGRIDILCSNAGIFPQHYLKDMTAEDWDLVNTVNLKGTFFLVQAALNVMEKQHYGRIVLTSSITGERVGLPGYSHYGASKAGQLGFMRSAALEYAGQGITINAVMPGMIMTEGLQAFGDDFLNHIKTITPMGALGTPEDIAYAVCFLASDEAKYITGQTIVVDGGQVLPEI